MSIKMCCGTHGVDPFVHPTLGFEGGRCRKVQVSRRLRHASRQVRSERGSALIEMALVLPVLLVLVTGIATFGIAFGNYLSLADAVGISGRQLAISRGNTTDPCSLAAASLQSALPSGMTPANLTFTFKFSGVGYGPFNGVSNTSCSSPSNTTGAAGNLLQGQNVQLIVSYPCQLTAYGYNYAPTCNLTAQVTEMVQ